jgi:hypothetical protein
LLSNGVITRLAVLVFTNLAHAGAKKVHLAAVGTEYQFDIFEVVSQASANRVDLVGEHLCLSRVIAPTPAREIALCLSAPQQSCHRKFRFNFFRSTSHNGSPASSECETIHPEEAPARASLCYESEQSGKPDCRGSKTEARKKPKIRTPKKRGLQTLFI